MTGRSFEEIGFACNPFRALTPEEWIRAAVIPENVRRAALAGGHLQILGETGFGKTTALRALADGFRLAGVRCAYEYLPRGSNRFQAKTSGLDVYLLDEAQRLSEGFLFIRNERARLIRAAKAGVRLILGSHEDLADPFRAAGVPLRTARLHPPAPEELAEILERRLALFARKDNRARFSGEAVIWLGTTFNGDLRTMEYLLYEYFQTERPAGIISGGCLREAMQTFTPPTVGPG
ncbi:MAG: hypothetical protein JW748_03590 [Anaerolineales bacterium]|nr:hypothetical protein [Anaerolineales bacterium]